MGLHDNTYTKVYNTLSFLLYPFEWVMVNNLLFVYLQQVTKHTDYKASFSETAISISNFSFSYCNICLLILSVRITLKQIIQHTFLFRSHCLHRANYVHILQAKRLIQNNKTR